MLKLLKCEFKKFNKTYINSLSFLGMIFPVLLVTIMYIAKRKDFIENGTYTWEAFNSNVFILFVILVAPIITSFIAVYSIFYEYQSRTLKNIIASPHSRSSIIISKLIYVSIYVLIQYVLVVLINVICGYLLGFEMSLKDCLDKSLQLVFAGISTIALVPIMMFLTLVFKSFVPPMVITVSGTIANAMLLNWDKSFLSIWSVPADLALILRDKLQMDIIYPVISAVSYCVVFLILVMVHFNTSDKQPS